MPVRSRISPGLRKRVIARDGMFCRYCGIAVVAIADYPFDKPQPNRVAKVGLFSLDHIHPKKAGGQTTLDNLAVSCYQCNNRKADREHYKPRYMSAQKQSKTPI